MAKDRFHGVVKTALVKDGWNVTHDPYEVNVGTTEMYIDLAAEQIIAAERGLERIAVEIKSFIGDSTISEFHTALGQYLNYQAALEEVDSQRQLYLAVPYVVYRAAFESGFIASMVKRYSLSLIIYDPAQEVIVRWKR